MSPELAIPMAAVPRSPALVVGIGLVVAVGVGVGTYWLRRQQPSEESLEQQRRERLTVEGRLVDGSITETRWLTDGGQPVPHVLIYRYRIAGVTYECGQDVRSLAEHVQHVRIDLPVQVRFDPRNPGNSIVVSESWTGLRMSTLPENLIHAPLQETVAPDAQS